MSAIKLLWFFFWRGVLCGLLLFATTRAFYFPLAGDVHDYLAMAGQRAHWWV